MLQAGTLGRIGLSLGMGMLAAFGAARGADSDWSMVGGQLNSQRYSALTQIKRGNVAQLAGAWVSSAFDDGANSRVTPVVLDGRMYLSAGVHVYAIDAATGKPVWAHALGQADDAKSAAGLMAFSHSENPLPNAQGLALGEGLIFVGTANGAVYALRQSDGAVIWSVSLRDAPPHPVQNVSAAPIYANGVVYVSLATVERLFGRVLALDAKSGRELWRFNVVPQGSEAGAQSWPANADARAHGGGNVWLPPAIDEQLGLVYFGTGNASPIKGGERRPGNDLYTASVIALDMKSGQLRWYYQLVHHDLWEMDVATPLVLVPTDTGEMIAAMRADGMLFRLDAASGKPLSKIEELPAEQEAADATAPTQPSAVGVESILPSCDSYRRFVPAGFELHCNFAPPSYQHLNILSPGYGVRVNPMSYSPQTHLLYAQGLGALEWRRRTSDSLAYEQNGFGRVPGIEAARSHTLAAIDVRTGKIAWRQVTQGAGPNAGGPSGAGGGFVVTGGGLLFHRSGDGAFVALDAQSGQVMWRYWTGAIGGSASPISYAVNGQQYVAVVDNNVVRAFTLNGPLAAAVEPPAAALTKPSFFTGPIQDVKMVELASLRQENPYQTGTRYGVDEYGPYPYRARVEGLSVAFGNNGHETHTIVAIDGSWTTGPIKPGDTATVTFKTAGAYGYRCQEHPFTYGELIVGQGKSGQAAVAASADGEQVYARDCASCHGADLAGGERGASALVGTGFLARWHGRTAGDLLDRTRSSMPATAPGSLSDADYIAITRYMLSANGIEEKSGSIEGLRRVPLEHP